MDILQKLTNALSQKKLTLATAESCTAGYVSYLLTKTPGSSAVFKGSVVSYSLESKQKIFKISSCLLNQYQGVSKEIAALLAVKTKKMFCAAIGASVVGFAGPGAPHKRDIGTVFIAIVDKKSCVVKRLRLKGSRDQIRKRASAALINLIYEIIHCY